MTCNKKSLSRRSPWGLQASHNRAACLPRHQPGSVLGLRLIPFISVPLQGSGQSSPGAPGVAVPGEEGPAPRLPLQADLSPPHREASPSLAIKRLQPGAEQ